jgi:hypothetical protein
MSLVLMAFLLPVPVQAVEFAIVGPRAVGMGGAGVAVTDDALATYWNPAGLAMKKTIDVRGQVSAQISDRVGVLQTLQDVNDLTGTRPSAATLESDRQRLQNLIDRLNQPGAAASAAAAGGVYMKGYWGNHAFGFNVSDVATGGTFVPTPLTVTCTSTNGAGGPSCPGGPATPNTLNVNGSLALRGLEARQAGFSYAYAFADSKFALGATAKLIQGVAYSDSVTAQGSEEGFELVKDLGNSKTTTAFSIDAGAIFRPASWLRIGVVGKDLTKPKFSAQNGDEFKLEPQFRGGIAVNPYHSLTVSFDSDIVANRTFVPGYKSQIMSLGAEQKLLWNILALRIGALKNVQDAKAAIVPTAGIGIRIFAFQFDVGGGYDFREKQGLASASLGLTF